MLLNKLLAGALALGLTTAASAQNAPRSVVLGIGSGATGTAAPVTVQDGTGQPVVLGQINGATHVWMPTLPSSVTGEPARAQAAESTNATAAANALSAAQAAQSTANAAVPAGGAVDSNTVLGRTEAVRAADRINALDKGVSAASSDNASALAAACTAANAAGKILYVPAGVYLADYTSLGCSIAGDGRDLTIIRRKPASTLGSFLNIGAVGGVSLSDLTIDGNKANETVAAHDLTVTGAWSLNLTRVRVTGAKGGHGVLTQNLADAAQNTASTIERLKVDTNDQDGFHHHGTSQDLSILNSLSTGNGTQGFGIENWTFPYTSSVAGTINRLRLVNSTANNNGSSGFSLSGFWEVGATSFATAVYGPGNDPITNADIQGLSANGNGGYGVALQVNASTVRGIHTAGNGTNASSFAGLLANVENTSITDVDVNEPGLQFGVDAGGAYYSSFSRVHAVGPQLGLNLGAARYTSADRTRCEGLTTAGICVSLARVDGASSLLLWDWSASHDTITGTNCSLTLTTQGCIYVENDPQYVTVKDNYSTGNENYTAYQFECTVGCNYSNNKTDGTANTCPGAVNGGTNLSFSDWCDDVTITYIPNAGPINGGIYTHFTVAYLTAIYDATVTAMGSGYTTPVATFTGGSCTTEPTALAGRRPSDGAVSNLKLQTIGAGCTGVPTCTITDSGGTGSGATCTASKVALNSLNGRRILVHQFALSTATFSPTATVYTPNGEPFVAPLRTDFVLTGYTTAGSGEWHITSPSPVVVGTGAPLFIPKLSAAPTTAPGAGASYLYALAGTNSGTCKLQGMAGTSTTPVTILDNIGSGC